MASYESLAIKNAASTGTVVQVGTDTPVAIRLEHVGTGAITSVTTTTATNIVFVSDDYTQTYAFATHTTVGALVDAINAGNCTEAAGGILWKAKVLDTVRSEATASQFVDGAITAGTVNGVSYYDVLVDTDAADYLAVRLTYDRGFDKPHKARHRVDLEEIVYYADLGTAAAAGLKVYKIDADGVTETLVLSYLSVDTTTTTENFASGEGCLSGDIGGDIVVKLDDSGNLADSTSNYLRVSGKIV